MAMLERSLSFRKSCLKCAHLTQPMAATLFENLQNFGSFEHEKNLIFYHLLDSDLNKVVINVLKVCTG